MRFIHTGIDRLLDVPVSSLQPLRINVFMLAGSCNCATSPAGNMQNEVRRKEDKSRQRKVRLGPHKPNATM